jgi:nucleotide-binding universal stress UspA family protein
VPYAYFAADALRLPGDHSEIPDGDDVVVQLGNSDRVDAAGVAPVFARIVCGVDGTLAGQIAADQAMALAGAEGDVLVVCAQGSLGQAPAGQSLMTRRAQRALEAAQEMASRIGADCEVELAHVTNPFELLLERAHGADLLVVGSRGRSRTGETALGSTAAMAVHASNISVLVARRAPRAGVFPQRILVATDGSSSARAALGVAARVARQADAHLCLLSVEPRLRGDRTALRTEIDELELEAERRVSHIQAAGEASEQIVAAAAEENADLVVTGGRDPSGVPPFGSVSATVAHRARCSVLIAR